VSSVLGVAIAAGAPRSRALVSKPPTSGVAFALIAVQYFIVNLLAFAVIAAVLL
jgi:hypothetical protein